MDVRSQVLKSLQSPNSVQNLEYLLYRGTYDPEHLIKQAILYCLQIEHNWTEIARRLTIWKNLLPWGHSFLERMSKRAQQPILTMKFTHPQLLKQEILRLADIYETNRKQQLIPAVVQKDQKPTIDETQLFINPHPPEQSARRVSIKQRLESTGEQMFSFLQKPEAQAPDAFQRIMHECQFTVSPRPAAVRYTFSGNIKLSERDIDNEVTSKKATGRQTRVRDTVPFVPEVPELFSPKSKEEIAECRTDPFRVLMKTQQKDYLKMLDWSKR